MNDAFFLRQTGFNNAEGLTAGQFAGQQSAILAKHCSLLQQY